MRKYTEAQIKDKIAKLMEFASDPAANEVEAAAMFSKAQELMREWGVTEWERLKAANKPVGEIVMVTCWWNSDPRQIWEMDMAQAVAMLYDVQSAINKTQAKFYGVKGQVDLAVYAFKYLQHHLEQWSKQRAKEYGKKYLAETGRSYVKDGKRREYIRSWLSAAVIAMWNKWYEEKEAAKKATESYALMLVDQNALIEAFEIQTYGKPLKKGRDRGAFRSNASSAGLIQGAEDGKTIEIRSALGDGSDLPRLR